MRILTVSMLIASLLLTGAGQFECLGMLNWLAIPFSALTALLASLGLLVDRDPETDAVRESGIYLAGLLGGIALAGLGMVRCFLGGGVF